MASFTNDQVFDVLIIGCGAVGAAVAREMTLLGQKCIVLEKNIDVLSEASSGNTGHLVSLIFLHKRKNYVGKLHYWSTQSLFLIPYGPLSLC